MATRKPLFQNAEGFSEEMQNADDILLGGLSMSGNIAMGTNKITGLGDPTLAQDAATKAYVDALSNGLDWKESVRLATAAALPANTPAGSGVGATLTANANGALSVDGVAVVNGDRILVKDEGSADNGIYVVTAAGDGSNPFVLTRATDFDQNAEVTAGAAMFVEEGSANADTGYVLTTNDPIVVDTTVLAFALFSTVALLTYDAGLIKSGNSIAVELDTAADAQGTGDGGGSSGLEFDAAGAGGQLRAKVDPAGGIQRLAAGLALEIDDTPNTLDVDADGLKVVGLPSLFLVNGVAVGATVTAPNLDTLTNGSNADALHTHAGVDADTLACVMTASGALSAGDPVYMNGNDTASEGDASDAAKDNIVGIAGAAILNAATGQIVKAGVATGVLSGATAGVRYYMAVGGGLTTTAPSGSGNRIWQIGFAKNATDLLVQLQDFGKKA